MNLLIQSYGKWLLLLVAIAVIAEVVWNWKNERKVYEKKETVANLAILVGHVVFKVLLTGYQLFILQWISQWQFFSLPKNALVFGATFILVDFVYYWYHRWSHEVPFLWGFHLVHHSSQQINFSSAYRLHWLNGLFTPFFFASLALIGIPIDWIVLSISLNLLYQFFLHTQMVGKLGPLEGVLDTPSAHRVHHAKNPQYLDKNFGGVFMIWDRIFGTYIKETEPPIYGITEGKVGYNPLKIMAFGFTKLINKTKHQKTI